MHRHGAKSCERHVYDYLLRSKFILTDILFGACSYAIKNFFKKDDIERVAKANR